MFLSFAINMEDEANIQMVVVAVMAAVIKNKRKGKKRKNREEWTKKGFFLVSHLVYVLKRL